MLVVKIKKYLFMLAVILPIGVVQAGVIPVGVSVQGEVGFDDVNSYVGGTSQSDVMGVGVKSSSVNDGVVTGDNPVSDQLTNPLFVNANLSSNNQEVDFEYVSYSFDVLIENNMASDAEFFFTFDYYQDLSVNGDEQNFDDVSIDSYVALFDDLGDEITSSYAYSDLVDGPSSNTGSVNFSFNVAAGEQLSFGGFLDMNAYAFGDSGIGFSALTDFSLSLTEVKYQSKDVPAPAMWSVFLIAGFMMVTRKKN